MCVYSFEIEESESKEQNFNIPTFYQASMPVCDEGIFFGRNRDSTKPNITGMRADQGLSADS